MSARPLALRTRLLRFYLVGLAGVGVQLASLGVLVQAGVPSVAAAGLAVEAAVLHNFAWHTRWTWDDRAASGSQRWRLHLGRLARFHAANGLVSLTVNMGAMAMLAEVLGLQPLMAGLCGISGASLLNLMAADRLVFRASTKVPEE